MTDLKIGLGARRLKAVGRRLSEDAPRFRLGKNRSNQPAVNRNDLTGNIARFLAKKKPHQGGDLG